MADLTTIPDMPPWSIDYDFSQSNPVVRTPSVRGFTRQGRKSKRQVTIAQVERKLTGPQLQYFESFIRTQADYGRDAFTDKYKDGSGVQSGLVRVVDGAYSVATNDQHFIVSCSIEVLR